MKKKYYAFKIFLFALCVSTLVPVLSVYGTPLVQGVSGTIIDGGKLVISGNDFGSHGDFGGADGYLNYVFEDGESGPNITNPKAVTIYSKMSTNHNRPGSTRNLLHERTLATETYTAASGAQITTNQKLNMKFVTPGSLTPVHTYFSSMWIRASDDIATISEDGNQQIKIMMTGGAQESGTREYFQFSGAATNGNFRFLIENHSLAQTICTDLTKDCYGAPFAGTWRRLDIYTSWPDASTSNVDKIQFYLDGVRVVNTTFAAGTGVSLDTSSHYTNFPGYIDNRTGSSFNLQTDNHYVDFTQARVEISDRATWSETVPAHKEIQIPLNWSNSSITVDAKIAAFPADKQLYLYVVDSQGNVNNAGFPIPAQKSTNLMPVKDFILAH